jgi:hypothetical protein
MTIKTLATRFNVLEVFIRIKLFFFFVQLLFLLLAAALAFRRTFAAVATNFRIAGAFRLFVQGHATVALFFVLFHNFIYLIYYQPLDNYTRQG